MKIFVLIILLSQFGLSQNKIYSKLDTWLEDISVRSEIENEVFKKHWEIIDELFLDLGLPTREDLIVRYSMGRGYAVIGDKAQRLPLLITYNESDLDFEIQVTDLDLWSYETVTSLMLDQLINIKFDLIKRKELDRITNEESEDYDQAARMVKVHFDSLKYQSKIWNKLFGIDNKCGYKAKNTDEKLPMIFLGDGSRWLPLNQDTKFKDWLASEGGRSTQVAWQKFFDR